MNGSFLKRMLSRITDDLPFRQKQGRSMLSQRPLVCITLLFSLGLYVGIRWLFPVMWLVYAGLVLSLAWALVKGLRKESLSGAACMAAFWLALCYGIYVAHPTLPPEGKYRIEATVAETTERSKDQGKIRTPLQNLTLTDEGGRQYVLLRGYWTYTPKQGVPSLYEGQKISFSARLYHPSPRLNPYGFDMQMYLWQKQMNVGISGCRDFSFDSPVQSSHCSARIRLRLLLSERFDRYFGSRSGLPKALLLGMRDGLEEETTEAFRNAGIAHILAISGLHISLLAGVLLWLLKVMRVNVKVQLVLIAGFLLGYCYFLGFTASVVRASVLTVVLLWAQSLRRKRDSLTALSFAALLILVLRPFDLFNIGFQLSFLAVLGILLLGDVLCFAVDQTALKRPALLNQAYKAYAVTLAAFLFTVVPSVNTFHRLSLIALPFGPLACFYVGLLMPLYLLTALLMALAPPVIPWLMPLVGGMTDIFTQGTRLLADLPFVVISLPAFPFALTALMYGVFLILSRYFAGSKRTKHQLVLLFSLLSLAILLFPQKNMVRYIQLSVGSADAAIVEDGRKTYVIDTGVHGGDLASYCLSTGRKIDHLFITHLHEDHIGGLQQLLEQKVPIGEILLPEGAMKAEKISRGIAILAQAEKKGIPMRYLTQGDIIRGNKVSAAVLWPYQEQVRSGCDANDTSLCLRWDLDGVSVLTLGDMTSTYERYAAVPSDVLKVAHHGSAHSSKEAFLSEVNPQLALISNGLTDEQRAVKVLRRLDQIGCDVYTTQYHGALIMQAEQKKLSIRYFCPPKGGAYEGR